MHARFPLAFLTLSLIASASPIAAAESSEDVTTDVTFFGHVFGWGRGSPMPMNTQFPKGEADYSIGSQYLCGQGVPAASAVLASTAPSCGEDFDGNEEWWYTTAGFVQIKEYTEFDYSKLHNERGLTKDTTLDTAKDIVAEFYMSADVHGWSTAFCYPPAMPNDAPWPVPCWNWDPGYLHQWQVEATVYTGVLGEYGGAADESPDIAAAFSEGKLSPLAKGISVPTDVQSLEATGNPTVWKFDINLGKPTRNVIKKEESYVVRFKWWSLEPTGPTMLPENFNINSGEFYPPTIKLPVKGAFTVEMVLPQFVYGKLVLLGIMNTPWGSYDVDHESVKLEIKNSKTGTAFEPRNIQRLADFSVAHGGHYKPVNVTYVWDYTADGLPAGDYEATVTASNFQASAKSSCTGKFTVLAGGQTGPITVGQCGIRTITDEQLQNVQQGSANDANKPGGDNTAGPAPLPPVGLFGVPFLLIAVRRWRK